MNSVLIVDDDDEDNSERTKLFIEARRWHRRGYNVVPQAHDGSKHPGVSWKDFQVRRITSDEVQEHFGLYTRGVGFITGIVSAVIVIESDGPEGEAVLQEFEALCGPLPETLTIRSGSGRGLHRHFKHPGYRVKTKANPSIKLDVKGDGGFCLLPPSLHKSGGRYEIVHEAEPADLPEGLLTFIEKKWPAKAIEEKGIINEIRLNEPGIFGSNGSLGPLPAHLIDAFRPNISVLEPPPVEEMHAMLEYLTSKEAFKDYDPWIKAGMALKTAYADDGFDLWAVTHEDDRARAAADEKWRSFTYEMKPGEITVGSLIKKARDLGFVRSQNSAHMVDTTPDARERLADKFTEAFAPIASGGLTAPKGDVLNGKLFADMFRGKLLYIHETNEWLQYDDTSGFVHAPPGEAERAAKAVVAVLTDQAAGAWKANPEDATAKALMSHVKRSSQAPQIKAMIEMAKSEPGMTARLSDFDNDPMLLGVTNGVLDLRTGQLLPTSPNILVSKRCKVAYEPHAQCPRFEQFMAEIQPDEEVREFLQRWIGYGLTGLTSEQKFAFFYGSGANGKSVFIEVIAWLLGDYALRMATEVLMSYKRNPQGASPEIVALKGARYAYANETVEGRHLDDARVKEMTGGDTLTGRVPYGRAAINFQPTHKLSIAGNHKPEISDASNGMWRRVMLIPFEQTIAPDKRDAQLIDKLKAEGSGILNWALQGLLAWQKNGLQVPQSITAATEAYRDEQDILGEWISGSCNAGATLSASKVKLYESYRAWCEENGYMPLAQGRLTKRLNERGYRLAPDKRTVNGLALKPPDQRAAWK